MDPSYWSYTSQYVYNCNIAYTCINNHVHFRFCWLWLLFTYCTVNCIMTYLFYTQLFYYSRLRIVCILHIYECVTYYLCKCKSSICLCQWDTVWNLTMITNQGCVFVYITCLLYQPFDYALFWLLWSLDSCVCFTKWAKHM